MTLTKRHDVPGTDHWFELRDVSELNSDQQDEYTALAIQVRQDKQAAVAAARPVNPAVAPDPDEADPPVKLTPVDTRPLRDLLLSWVLADSTFGVPVRWPLPIVANNVLRKALEPYYGALNGEVPKPETTESGTSTSSTTSPAPAPALPPEPAPEP